MKTAILLAGLLLQPAPEVTLQNLDPHCYREVIRTAPTELTANVAPGLSAIYTLRICYEAGTGFGPWRGVSVGIPDEPGKDNPEIKLTALCQLVTGSNLWAWYKTPPDLGALDFTFVDICVLNVTVTRKARG
ncbi:hypothetical protein G7078_07795 [Sphingomonas sinipercae]|uniref:Uncharacterized protein n=1 Tax=Sphingomonas sinipercae TaxID=2714944 RepID=A0A6G7ZNY3_9SPHN|nr:hypothetical protein [Sphingomonas sinipercae]QIL02694.1 hypothetical protein G7078_07795 [Sphingomonas sinipercae]